MSVWLKLTPVGGDGKTLVNLEAMAIIEKDSTGHALSRITSAAGQYRHYHESVEEICEMIATNGYVVEYDKTNFEAVSTG